MTTTIGVTGATGRVGSILVELAPQMPGVKLAQAFGRSDSLPARPEFDVLVDFTVPAASVGYAAWCAEHGVALVTGTTGWSEADWMALDEAAKKTAVLVSPNTALGVNLLFGLAARAAQALGDEVDIEIVETHHRNKVDAPSGTALRLLEAVAEARKQSTDVARFARHGQIGARPRGEIGMATLRGGDVVGEHTVHYLWEGERIELTHRATDRRVFARGALTCAKWLRGRAPGHYQMSDVLGL